MKLQILIVLLMVGIASSAAIPADRLYDWEPGVTVGVRGGILNRTTIFTNLTGIDATGATDVSAEINAALSACPSNQVVLLPAGRFKLSNPISQTTQDWVTLRGAGIGQTILESHVSSGYATIVWTETDWPIPAPSITVSAGATAGSSNVTVSSVSGVSVGNMIRIGQTSPDYVFTTGSLTNLQHSTHIVEATNATSITFWPPLALTLTNSPTVAAYTLAVKGIGFEDFTINLTNSTVAAAYMYQAWGCWFDSVAVVGSNTRQLWLDIWSGGEIRDCQFSGTRSSGPGHEGVDLYQQACWNLVENNWSDNGGYPAIITGDGAGGCVGNVVAYNWCGPIDSGSGVAGAAFSVNHGPHNMFNLFEGNVGQMFQSDGYFGSASHNTVFRNALTGYYFTNTISFQRAVDLCRWSRYFNVAGNVLGTNAQTFTYSTQSNGFTGPLIYRFGYPNMGNMGYTGTNPPSASADALDTYVESTVVLVANWDSSTGGTVNDDTIPSSYYRSERPAWFGGVAWPPIGPDVSGLANMIPAEYRFRGIDLPPVYQPYRATTARVGTIRSP